MFLLSESELVSSIPLKTISRIDVSFYKSRNESLNIFNLELDFDENLIPLITSTLECKPVLISRKTYFGMDTDYIIEHPITCNSNLNLGSILGSILGEYNDYKGRFPSFHLDIDAFNKNKNKNSSNQKTYWQSRKLHYSNVYVKSQELVRIYSREDSNSNGDARSNSKIFNPQDALGCKEEIVIYWSVYGMSKFELCILPNTDVLVNRVSPTKNNKKCIWHLVVDVIEDNNFIDSKVDAVNIWLEKIHKIKSTIKIANQETKTEEI
jgi:hypothetical protein